MSCENLQPGRRRSKYVRKVSFGSHTILQHDVLIISDTLKDKRFSGRKIAVFSKKQTIFVQGDSSDAVLYIQKGKVKLTVVSQIGKEATIGILNEGDFFGEGCLTG